MGRPHANRAPMKDRPERDKPRYRLPYRIRAPAINVYRKRKKKMPRLSHKQITTTLACWIAVAGGGMLPLCPASAQDTDLTGNSASAIPEIYQETDRLHDSLFLSATSSYLTGATEEALDAYLLLLEEEPGNATAAFQIANILSSRKKFAEARIYAEKAALLQPENEWFQLLLAQLYKSNREFGQAARIFAKLQELRPDKLDYAYERANMYILQNDLRSAIAVYDGLQDRLGYTDAWTMQKYKIYLSIADDKAAKREIEEISKAIPGQPKYLEMLAQICMKEKDYKQAFSYLKQVQAIKPDDPYVHVSLVDYYWSTGNLKQARLSLEEAVGNARLDFPTKLNLIKAYYSETGKEKPRLDEKEIEHASTLFQLLNETNPKEAEGFFEHGRLRLMLGKPEEAIPLLEKAISLDSNVSSSWELLLLAGNEVRDTLLIRKAGMQAAERFPEQAFPYMYLAVTSFLNKESDNAIRYAELCRQRNRGHNEFMEKITLQIIGDACFETGKMKESLDAYQALFELDPNDPYVRNNYAYYLALSRQNLDFAEALAGNLCKTDPRNPTFLDTYAWVLYQNGKYEKALEFIEAACKHDTEKDATILDHYGDILYQTGKKKEALEYWKKAWKKNADEQIRKKIQKEEPSWNN